jgi:site-specific DNA recombinase
MKNEQLKVGIYARVSKKEQDSGMQLTATREFCQRNSHEVIGEYIDNGFSGKRESRPAFNRLLEDMRTGKINCIMVYKLDRIGRSLSHLLKLFEEFKKRNVEFISVTQNINTTTPEGELFLRMLMIFAEYERELLIFRINDGLDEAKSNGVKLGRPKGSADKNGRRTLGYRARWESLREKRNAVFA